MSLAAAQVDFAARLSADEYFADITVLQERQGDLDNEIARAIGGITKKAGKLGAFVVVAAAEADVGSGDAPLQFDGTRINIFVFENVTLNNGTAGTKKAAIDIATRICEVLHHYRPNGIGQTAFCDRDAIRPEKPPAKGVIAYRVAIRVPVNEDVPTKVSTPTISPETGAAPQTVTITCATAGASIYYTTDESYPWSGNTAATLYSTPFAVAAAAVIRAVAFKSDNIASDSALAVIT